MLVFRKGFCFVEHGSAIEGEIYKILDTTTCHNRKKKVPATIRQRGGKFFNFLTMIHVYDITIMTAISFKIFI